MKWWIFICLMIMMNCVYGQEDHMPVNEDFFENIAEKEETVIFDDEEEYWRLADLKTFRINLNTANIDELREIPGITEQKILSFLNYRTHLGSLLSLYELQAVPGWDVEFIRQILPYVKVGKEDFAGWKNTLRGGLNQLLIKYVPALLKDGEPVGNYEGSSDKMLMRFRYKAGKTFQYGILAEKDAGEKIEFRNNKPGADFLSAHLFLRNAGNIKQLAIGDYHVNLGQGLIHWQSFSSLRSTEITSIKKHSEKIRPYSSAGEFNFHRGIAMQYALHDLQFLVFYSGRKLSSNIEGDSVTSFYTSGLHRTENEMEKRNRLGMQAMGWSAGFRKPGWGMNVNGVAYAFSKPLTKRNEPYQVFAIRDDKWRNFSADFYYTLKNLHVFAEFAIDKLLYQAHLTGAIISLHRNVDLSLLFRNISPGYRSLFSAAFTVNSEVNNETGIFMGYAVRPFQQIKLEGYFDLFHFPWVKFRVDLPSGGFEKMLKVTYRPERNTEWYIRINYRERIQNQLTDVLALPEIISQLSFRNHLSIDVSRYLAFSARTEHKTYKVHGIYNEEGFLAYIQGKIQLNDLPVNLRMRMQYHKTNGYNSRIYVYETENPGGGRAVGYYGEGFRLISDITIKFNINQHFTTRPKKIFFNISPGLTVHPKNENFKTNSVSIVNRIFPELRMNFYYEF